MMKQLVGNRNESWVVIVGLIVGIVIFAYFSAGGNMGTFTITLLSGLLRAMLLFLVAAGLSLIFGLMGVLNFAQGAYFMVGAYLAYDIQHPSSGVISFGQHIPDPGLRFVVGIIVAIAVGGALGADALGTAAGAGVGEHDLVKTALEEAGCETLFWRVKIRPGSPFSFGVIPRAGRAPLPVFGLPGNPVSALVTFEILVRPALRRMLGRTAVYPRTVAVEAAHDMRMPAGLVRFLRVRLERRGDGLPRAHLTGPQGSGILTSVAAADALLVVPLDVEHVAAGTVLRAVPLHGADEADEADDADETPDTLHT